MTKDGNMRQAATHAQRMRSFRAARRHSSQVVFLRRTILASIIIGSVSLIGIGWFNPFGSKAPEITIKGSNLDGTRVTMEQPRLAGYRRDGRPYEVNADTGVQDVREPNVMELNNLDAKIGMIDQTTVRVISSAGIYDTFREFMDFRNAVRVRSNTYDIDMKSARMDYKSGTMVTDEDVKVLITEGEILANKMNMIDNGQSIIFEGKVRSVFSSKSGPASVAGEKAQ